MSKITIPHEALEAAAEDLFHIQYDDSKGSWSDAPEWLKVTIRSEARAACLAMLKAWPSAFVEGDPVPTWISRPAIILPLPQKEE